ncbi:MAG TPA: hypothetical protein VGS04_03280, partial [Nitrososphaerales archaeon]|nr:hypothetical protein [Nitrososphaerales archaeon]
GLFSGFLWISTAILQADAWNAPIYAPTANLATHIAFGISAYFLYRSAKSLVALQPAPVIVQRA